MPVKTLVNPTKSDFKPTMSKSEHATQYNSSYCTLYERITHLQQTIGNCAVEQLLSSELTHTIQRSEGAALAAQADPRWRFQRNVPRPGTRGRGLEMNPAFWQVTYTLTRPRPHYATMDFTQDAQHTAYQKALAYVNRHRSWGDAQVTAITITLAQGVTASSAAQDLMSPASAHLYGFECYTAASLVQFVGVLRELQRTAPATAQQTFDSTHADFRLVIPGLRDRDPQLHMGGRQIPRNLARLGTFTLRELRDDPRSRGLLRGDWVLLDNGTFIARGAFRRENATYLGSNRFHGHGINVHGSGSPSSLFTIDEYAANLASRSGVTLSADRILDEVRVRPIYRAP